ncbi:hypothetical protein Afer_0583 [Acidimicrobium ferrooxidans DSM 10331]|uniref:WYL domain-containing protein n=1 Tax=Acidimicrobium ferrooxidans (strain DSM 10331 / JCM 15462 / NBRC 103882 / ICP) TaxID=525909 RepID=C7M3E3_ACIFD|nr:WYL domain-containing protein [Acidimicrobium ferrooxidans]ACU53537.1 hypothetical protein Afer_0583 [Acidimicrobium ferrooxidans DSM 10331]
MVDVALERLVNVVTLLAEHPTPLERDEIVRTVPGFPASDAASARAFERVKETARSLGIEIETVTLPGRSRVGYRLRPTTWQLELDDAEVAALEAALGAVWVAGVEPGLARIGLAVGAVPARGRRSSLLDAPPAIVTAIAERAVIEIGYRGERRRLAPVGIGARWGHAYLVAADDDGVIKTFRVDRIDEPIVVLEAHHEIAPVPIDEVLPRHPRELVIDRPVQVTVQGPPERLAAVGADPETGSLRAANLDVVLADVLLHDLALVGPQLARERLADRLATAERALAATPTAKVPRAGVERTNLATRYAMLQTMLRVLGERGRAPLSELAAVAGTTRELAAELLETASLCGLPPYSPDVLLEVLVDDPDGEVEARLERTPPRGSLAIEEAVSVGATLEALREALGGTLPPVLDRLRARIAEGLGVVPRLVTEPGERASLVTVHEAIVLGACLRFRYAPIGAPSGERRVRPREVHALDGVWYLDAVTSDGRIRTFRLDRMSELVVEAGCDIEESDRSPATTTVSFVVDVPRALEPLAEYLLGSAAEAVQGGVLVRAHSIGWAARVVVALGATPVAGPATLFDEARAVLAAARRRLEADRDD